jgi:hypothetical protein
MKTKLLVLATLLPIISIAQNVNIPDANFKAALLSNTSLNTNMDSEIQVSEAQAYTGDLYLSSLNINNLTGIESFTSLHGLIW